MENRVQVSPLLRITLISSGIAATYSAIVLTALPEQTARWFAWDIQPPITAAYLGAWYASGVPAMFLLARRGTPWSQVRALVPAQFVLSVALVVATALHADRFLWGSPVAWLWLVLYAANPPLLIFLYLRHRRLGPEPDRMPLGKMFRRTMAALAVVSAASGLVAMVDPGIAAQLWPWPLTPLTGRVVGSWLLLAAAGLAAMAAERDWDALRVFFPQLAVVFVLMLVGVARFPESLDAGPALTWLYIVVVGAGLVASVLTVAVYERAGRVAQPA